MGSAFPDNLEHRNHHLLRRCAFDTQARELGREKLARRCSRPRFFLGLLYIAPLPVDPEAYSQGLSNAADICAVADVPGCPKH